MRKFALIPVIDLSGQTKGQFLEIMSEPAYFGGVNMDTLKSGGLSQNILVAKEVLKHLNICPKSATLCLTNFLADVSNTQGINLGLLLACFLQTPTCSYQKIIVTGQLNSASAQLSVTTALHFEAKLHAILTLGTQPEPIPFFFPQAMDTYKYKPLLLRLETINITLKPIDSLFDALSDFGISQANVN